MYNKCSTALTTHTTPAGVRVTSEVCEVPGIPIAGFRATPKNVVRLGRGRGGFSVLDLRYARPLHQWPHFETVTSEDKIYHIVI